MSSNSAGLKCAIRNKNIWEATNGTVEIVYIKAALYSYTLDVHATKSDNSVKTAHNKPVFHRLEQTVEQADVKKSDEETIKKECHRDV